MKDLQLSKASLDAFHMVPLHTQKPILILNYGFFQAESTNLGRQLFKNSLQKFFNESIANYNADTLLSRYGVDSFLHCVFNSTGSSINISRHKAKNKYIKSNQLWSKTTDMHKFILTLPTCHILSNNTITIDALASSINASISIREHCIITEQKDGIYIINNNFLGD